ncbi:MAG TPA: YhjD/YihY/BrkB family envelope integrity protein, partial [Thermoanaerobaculia bacterium]|nr:YhjD/YihY/BrkB family envelope integrity protein [Thermoanaerobaculia bacterium]
DGRGVGLAAGLAYSSLLSFIPLVAAVTVLTSTFFGEKGTGFYRLLRFFVPGTSREVLSGVAALVDEAQTASWVATAFLVLTSLRVYFEVEGAANHLWGTLRPRRVRQRLALAVLVVVFGPVALGVATSFLLESGVPLTQLHLRGLLASIVGLTLVYKVIPSSQVRWGAAAAAGVLAGVGLTGLRQLFTLGFVAAAGAAKVYGAISAIAVFVTATGFAWTILLFGFSFAHAVQFRDELLAHDAPPPAAKKPGSLEEAVQLLLRLTEAWHAGVSLDIPSLAQTCGRAADDLRSRLKRLDTAGLVEVAGESVRLARPPDTITLYAVARAVGEAAPRAVPTGSEPAAAILRALYMRADAEERGVLQGTSLEDVYRPHARRRSESEHASDLRLGPSETAQPQGRRGAGHGSEHHPAAPADGTASGSGEGGGEKPASGSAGGSD